VQVARPCCASFAWVTPTARERSRVGAPTPPHRSATATQTPVHRAARPASVQRSHMGLQEVDLPAGVVMLRGGEVQAILRVSGVPLHQHSPQEAHTFLVQWAAALNAMPPQAAWLIRSRPGGLARDIVAKR